MDHGPKGLISQGENEKNAQHPQLTLQANRRGPRATVAATSGASGPLEWKISPLKVSRLEQEKYRKLLGG